MSAHAWTSSPIELTRTFGPGAGRLVSVDSIEFGRVADRLMSVADRQSLIRRVGGLS
jgi:hypothetical protein